MVHALIEQVLLTRDPRILVSLVPHFRPRTCKKGERLLNQGDVWDTVFFIEVGLLRVHILGSDGKDFNKSFWSEGTILFPITTEMETMPSVFGISALEDSVIWHVHLSVLGTCLQSQKLWEPLRAELLERVLDRKQKREFDLLTLDGKDRYQKLCASEPELAARVPLAHLASYLALTDVSLSRIRRQLKKS
jgi:CRP-like cAMP-binding protein